MLKHTYTYTINMNTIYNYYYCAALAVVALVPLQVSGEENVWLTESQDDQNSITDAITKIKSYGASDDKVMSVIDKAYDEFFKYVQNGIAPTTKKLEENSSKESSAIELKINNWLKELENINSISDNYKNKPENSLKKFEDTISEMVKDSPEFAKKINSAKPKYHDILVDFGNFMKDAITKLVAVINTAENQLKDAGNTASKK